MLAWLRAYPVTCMEQSGTCPLLRVCACQVGQQCLTTAPRHAQRKLEGGHLWTVAVSPKDCRPGGQFQLSSGSWEAGAGGLTPSSASCPECHCSRVSSPWWHCPGAAVALFYRAVVTHSRAAAYPSQGSAGSLSPFSVLITPPSPPALKGCIYLVQLLLLPWLPWAPSAFPCAVHGPLLA